MNINFVTGGELVLGRVIKAYNLENRSALAKYLGITASSLSLRYKRDNFPSDIVVRCMAETGVTLKWLATGEGEMFENNDDKLIELPIFALSDGDLISVDNVKLDKEVFEKKHVDRLVDDNHKTYFIVDSEKIIDGEQHLLVLGKTTMIRQLYWIDDEKIQIVDNFNKIERNANDVKILGRVVGFLS